MGEVTTKAVHPEQDDDPRLGPAIEGIVEAEIANATALDKAVLTLSSAALGLSLAFSKEIVSPATAVWIPLLFGSWALFTLTIAVNIAGLVFALRGYRDQWHLAMNVFRHRSKKEAELHAAMAALRESLYRFNRAQGILFVVSMTCLASYVGVNFPREAQMKQEGKAGTVKPTVMANDSVPARGYVPRTLERATPATGYVPATANGTSAQQPATSPVATSAGAPASQQSSGGTTPTPLKR